MTAETPSVEQAWEAFKATPLPAPTIETWRRFPREAFAFEKLSSGDAFTLTGLGRPVPKGAEVRPLEDGGPRPEFAAGPDFRRLEAANLALWRGGAYVRVPKGVKLAEPIHLEFVHDAARPSFPRVLVVIEEGAEAVVVEEHRGVSDGKPVSAAFSEVRIGDGAKARVVLVQDLPRGSAHYWRQDVRLGRDAVIEHSSVILGGARHKSDLNVYLDGVNARSVLRGVVLGRGDQVFDARTSQFHRAGRTTSDLAMRAALRGKARSLYTGLLRIERDALDCEAHQTNRNLLLSDAARADSTPILEILPDRVACKHAAASGPLDRAELFYLATRGFEPAEAERALVMAFFEPVLAAVPVEALRQRLTELVEKEAA